MPGKLVLVRHGQSVWNVENLFTGWMDVDLSGYRSRGSATNGRRTAARRHRAPDGVYVSAQARHPHPMADARGDGSAVAAGRAPLAAERAALQALQGLNKSQQTVERYGAAQVQIWRRSYDVPPRRSALTINATRASIRAMPMSIPANCRQPNR